MPNRETRRRRRNDPALDHWIKVTDDYGDVYQIFFRDVSGEDEWMYLQQTQHKAGGLCDIFLEGHVTLMGIAGLIWSQRRKSEKKLMVKDVMKTVSMATIPTLEMFDPDDVDDEYEDDEEPSKAETVELRSDKGLPDFGGNSDRSHPDSAPSTV